LHSKNYDFVEANSNRNASTRQVVSIVSLREARESSGQSKKEGRWITRGGATQRRIKYDERRRRGRKDERERERERERGREREGLRGTYMHAYNGAETTVQPRMHFIGPMPFIVHGTAGGSEEIAAR